jgi:hypothetical protein
MHVLLRLIWERQDLLQIHALVVQTVQRALQLSFKHLPLLCRLLFGLRFGKEGQGWVRGGEKEEKRETARQRARVTREPRAEGSLSFS